IAVSGARAADAVVVAEPEPAEYVKICDVYGAGYFYIPGTETCLRIGGYVRYDATAGSDAIKGFAGTDGNDARTGKEQDTWAKQARFTLKTWTGQETELGTLKTYTETRFNFGNWSSHANRLAVDDGNVIGAGGAGNSVSLNFAWIQLGGLRVGKDESAFDTFSGYAGNVINDTLVPYGNFDTNVVQYYFDAGNGFSAVVSLEQGSDNKFKADFDGDGVYTDKFVDYIGTIDSYVPHVVIGAKYTQGWGGINGVVAYDSNYETWAGKVRLDVNVSNALSLFVMGGYGQEKINLTNPLGHSFYKPWDGKWAVWGGGSYKFDEKTSFNLQASYDAGKTVGIAANVAYAVVPGFTVTGEVDYINHTKDNFYQTKSDGIGGVIRFQRDF
ncbi:MAG: porin, partial [Mesorhizobium sp.]|uniref:porin n=1 Tax=Mesorhizobium sp. TaxID=1871066 RepID=UPI001AD19E4B